MNIELSVITVNYNGLKDTCELIASIPNEPTMEIIVVDNGSSVNEAELIAGRFPHVRTVRSDANLGFAGGNNLGMKAARGRFFFLVNNDTIWGTLSADEQKGPLAHAYRTLIDRLTSHPNIGCVCPKIRFTWASQPIQFTGYTPLSGMTMRNHSIGFGEDDHGQYDQPHPTPYAHGAAMMLKREVVDAVGLMPECYFLYYEELDWSMMITRGGYEIWYEPGFTIYHKESQATGQNSPLKTYYLTRNRLLLNRRNKTGFYKWATYCYLIIAVAPRDIIKQSLSGQFRLAAATLRGIKDFITS